MKETMKSEVARSDNVVTEETSLLLPHTTLEHQESKVDRWNHTKTIYRGSSDDGRRTCNAVNLVFSCTLIGVIGVLLLASWPIWSHRSNLIPLDRTVLFLDASPLQKTEIESTSLRKLAKILVLPLYLDTLQNAIPKLTDSVQPADVYRCRKLLLRTRDSLDVFSIVYPNSTSVDADSTIDLWEMIRNLLDVGYTVVGEFQDLDHAHIQYTNEMLEVSRAHVLEWKRDFDQIHHGPRLKKILRFLDQPSDESFRHRESRLFWKMHSEVPAGRDGAAESLYSLRRSQAAKALELFSSVKGFDSVLESSVHEHFHSLRKELRCLTDEYDLFASIMFPKRCNPAVFVLKKARQYLGDINDLWTAFDTYNRAGILPAEQNRLTIQIKEAWQEFRNWVEEGAFEVSLRKLAELHQFAESPAFQSLQDFLLSRQRSPTTSFVVGNEAGDADTIISAITLAYIESVTQGFDKTPVVSIPKVEFQRKRPEVTLLLRLAGINQTTLLFIDDPIVEETQEAYLTLTDHNLMASAFQERGNWTVIEIVDHHQDEGYYLDTCVGDARNIAFVNDTALVASACTLVAERLFALWDPPYPASLSSLLMGVILLDSVGLSEDVGKVTQRDRDAVQGLLKGTNWAELPNESIRALSGSSAPDPVMFFNLLQDAKYDVSFWSSISVRDALQLDYKSFTSDDGKSFGVSSILMPEDDFLAKPSCLRKTLHFMNELNISFLAIMFAFRSRAGLHRQLALCGTRRFPISDVVDYLMESDANNPEPLQLHERPFKENTPDHRLAVRVFDQRNVVPSRKQIGPLLTTFFLNHPFHQMDSIPNSPSN